MRAAACLLLGACGFSVPSGVPSDATDAPKPDVPVNITWDVDATSKIGVPSSTNQWRDVITAAGFQADPPTDLWLMQESGGSLADSIGAVTLAPVNNVSYAQTMTGWTRHAVGTIEAAGDQGFINTASGNLDGTSHALLLYVAVVTAPSMTRSLAGIGFSYDHRYAAVATTAFSARGSVGSPGVGVAPPGVAVHPLLIEIKMTAPPQFVIFTDKEKITAPYVAPNGLGNLLMIGSASLGTPEARYLYGALWKGPSAQFTDANAKALLTRLGWTVTGF